MWQPALAANQWTSKPTAAATHALKPVDYQFEVLQIEGNGLSGLPQAYSPQCVPTDIGPLVPPLNIAAAFCDPPNNLYASVTPLLLNQIKVGQHIVMPTASALGPGNVELKITATNKTLIFYNPSSIPTCVSIGNIPPCTTDPQQHGYWIKYQHMFVAKCLDPKSNCIAQYDQNAPAFLLPTANASVSPGEVDQIGVSAGVNSLNSVIAFAPVADILTQLHNSPLPGAATNQYVGASITSAGNPSVQQQEFDFANYGDPDYANYAIVTTSGPWVSASNWMNGVHDPGHPNASVLSPTWDINNPNVLSWDLELDVTGKPFMNIDITQDGTFSAVCQSINGIYYPNQGQCPAAGKTPDRCALQPTLYYGPNDNSGFQLNAYATCIAGESKTNAPMDWSTVQ